MISFRAFISIYVLYLKQLMYVLAMIKNVNKPSLSSPSYHLLALLALSLLLICHFVISQTKRFFETVVLPQVLNSPDCYQSHLFIFDS